MTKPGRPKADQRRSEILAAALACFSERGYAAATLGDIREKSGASVGSIYHLFASKEEIASALYVEGLRSYQDGFTRQIAESFSPEGAVRRSVRYYLEWVEANEKLARFISNARHSELVPAVRDELRQMNRVFFGTLKENVEPHVRAGKVKEMPWELFVAVVMGPAHEHARLWLAGRSRLRPADAAPMLSDAAWDGVRVRRLKSRAATPG